MKSYNTSYAQTLEYILKFGLKQADPNRKGTFRYNVPFYTQTYNLRLNFPLLTTRDIKPNNAIHELIWMLKGDTNIKYLVDKKVNIWNLDAYNNYKKKYSDLVVNNLAQPQNIFTLEEFKDLIKKREISTLKNIQGIDNYTLGDLGKVYGYQWNKQLYSFLKELKENPFSSKLIINSWNIDELNDMIIPPCHYSFQVVCFPEKKEIGFDLIYNMRSSDVLLGKPTNDFFYGLLMLLLENITGYKARNLIYVANNVHLYDNQIEAANKIIKHTTVDYPEVTVNNKSLEEFLENKEVIIKNYNPKIKINVPMLTYTL